MSPVSRRASARTVTQVKASCSRPFHLSPPNTSEANSNLTTTSYGGSGSGKSSAKQFDLETQEWIDVIDIHEPDAVLPDITVYDYLLGIVKGTIQPNGSRLRAAVALVQYEKAKLKAVAITSFNDEFDERLRQAIEQTNKLIEDRKVQVIEAPNAAGETVSVDEVPDHGKPFAQNYKSRFRRL